VREEKEEWDGERQKGIEAVRELREKSAAQIALLEAAKESEAPADESEGARAGGGDGDEEMASVERDGPPNGNGVVASSEPVAHDVVAVHQTSTDAMDQDDDDAVEY
jgi:hypothetical protein